MAAAVAVPGIGQLPPQIGKLLLSHERHDPADHRVVPPVVQLSAEMPDVLAQVEAEAAPTALPPPSRAIDLPARRHRSYGAPPPR